MNYAVEHVAGRTFILAEDMAVMRSFMAPIPTEAGFYDLFVHGDPRGFSFLIKTEANGKKLWGDMSVREVADAVRTKLPPGVKLRLLSCDAGLEGGPAQQLANELNRTVWGADGTLYPEQLGVGARKMFVPEWGKLPDGTTIRGSFREFVPQRGSAALKGNGGNLPANEVHGEINR
jgi:hypothetical protein